MDYKFEFEKCYIEAYHNFRYTQGIFANIILSYVYFLRCTLKKENLGSTQKEHEL